MLTSCAFSLQIKTFSEDCTPEKQQYTKKTHKMQKARDLVNVRTNVGFISPRIKTRKQVQK